MLGDPMFPFIGHLQSLDRLHNAETVAVHDLALEQIGDGGQADMQVGPDVYLRDRPAGEPAACRASKRPAPPPYPPVPHHLDPKSTRLNSHHNLISYVLFFF